MRATAAAATATAVAAVSVTAARGDTTEHRAADTLPAAASGLPTWLQIVLWLAALTVPLALVERRFRRESKERLQSAAGAQANLSYDQLQEDVTSLRAELRAQKTEADALVRRALADAEYYQACLRIVEDEFTEFRQKIAATGLIQLEPRRPLPERPRP